MKRPKKPQNTERKQSKLPRKPPNKKSRSGDTKSPIKTKSSFHHLECEDDEYSSTNEYSDQQYDCVEYSHINIDTCGLNADKMEKDVFATIELQNRSHTKCTLRVKVDTGAQGNTLPLRIYKKMYPDDLDHNGRPVNVYPVPSTTQLTMYNKTTIECLGYVIFTCKYKNSKWCESKFYLVDIDQPAICGLPLSQALRLVTINCHTIESRSGKETKHYNSVNDLKTEFP